ncbi:hypothetical protein LEP48_02420 [Isoptericola sp. NEAU-Y5]|uniref:DUF4126 domain-containing protein n=1 Tax=Isoptericola luteus TaxID=2879484 RepID=A0ABS7ZAX5_9MICO|nr:hypothetical protein [Isoptericola sp. NEAU-Y5]MCA5892203.1 hypothetical protein [Isoptericola sp. NEAU-Y5]
MTAPLPVRALALGLAAGARATLGPAAPILGPVPRCAPGRSAAAAHRPSAAVRAVAVLAVVGELVGDTLPTTPSRLEHHGPEGRAVSGAVGGVLLARRRGAPVPDTLVAAAAGALAGLAGTGLGAAWRSAVARRGWPDLPAALAEDAVALALAAWATRA